MGIEVLGPLTVDGAGRFSPRDRTVLEALAARAGTSVSADQLVDALWGDRPPPSAHKVLQGCVVRLRKALGADTIRTTPGGYVLAVPADHLDTGRFEQAVARSRELLALGEVDRAAYLLTDALALWRGRPFAELEEWEPAAVEADRLHELRLEAEELRVDALLQAGRHREVLAPAHAMVRAEPLRERRWTLLALAQYHAGQQAAALRTLHQLRGVLAGQLGLDPGPDASALEEAILRQDPKLVAAAALPELGAACPYQGLRAYDVGDAERFFGRAAEVTACLVVLERESFLALVGPSGSGKSSLLRAGIAATLRARGVPFVVITPGARPLLALAGLESRPPATVLLVDQCEEVFTLCEDPAEAEQFLDRLAAEARPVAIALRADHLSALAANSQLRGKVEQALHLVGALGEDALRRAVEEPARQAGLLIEPGLVDLLVREVRDDPGALPLLSHALLETWKRREGHTLTVAGYRASGGIHGAVAQSAEQLYGRVEPDRRTIFRDLVLRLVSPGHQGEPVRSRVPRRLVAIDDEHARMIEMLVAARLVTTDEGAVEITHEALARAWPRLRGWLDDDVEGQRIRQHLSGAADAWDSLGRPGSELYRGVRLGRALDWQHRTRPVLSATERDFLQASRAAAEAEEHSAVERARVQTRLIRRLRVVLAGAVVLLVLALAAGGVAAVQSRRAAEHATAAESAARAALARGAATRASTEPDLTRSLLLGVAAVRMDPSPETLSGLMGTLARQPALIRSTPLAGEEAMTLDLHPDTETVAMLDATHRVQLLDLTTGELLAQAQVGEPRSEIEEVRPMRFSPDGSALAVASTALSKRPVVLLDPKTLEEAPTQPGGFGKGSWQVIDVRFSADSRSLVAVLKDVEVRGDERVTRALWAYVWREGSRWPVRVDLTVHGDWAAAALSPDGRLLYTATPDVRVHELGSGRERELHAAAAPGALAALELSPDGRTLGLALGATGQTRLLSAATGRVLHALALPGEQGAVRFSEDGRRVATVLWHDRDAAVWDVRTGRQLARIALGQGSSGAVDLDPEGRVLVTSANDDAVRIWDVDGRNRYLQRIPVRGLPWTPEDGGACFTTTASGGRYVAYTLCPGAPADSRQQLVILEVASAAAPPPTSTGAGYTFGGGSWDPASGTFIKAHGGRLHTWDGPSGKHTTGPRPGGYRVTEVDHSPDGSRLAIAELSGELTLLDAETRQPVAPSVDLGAPVCCVALGPDNRTAFALVGGPERTGFWNQGSSRWALVDLAAGRIRGEGEIGFPNAIWAAYSPDGSRVAAGGFGGEVALLDATTGDPVRPPGRPHEGGVVWVAFDQDGSRLVSAATDGTVVVWDARTATIRARITLPSQVVSSPEFLPDGRILIVPWWRDPAVYVWDPAAERAIAFACRAAGRDLTEAEWREHFPDDLQAETCPNP